MEKKLTSPKSFVNKKMQEEKRENTLAILWESGRKSKGEENARKSIYHHRGMPDGGNLGIFNHRVELKQS